MRAYPGFGRRRSPEDISSRPASVGEPADAPVEAAPGMSWGRRLKLLVLIIPIAFAWQELDLATARQAASDVSPGLRIAAERYQTPKGCPGSAWDEGQRMPRACVRGYGIPSGEIWAYGLTSPPPSSLGLALQVWFRAGDDAVLAHCGLGVGCKATYVVRGRFYDAWEPRA
ncbi:hypothetical protein [Caulobacter sp. 17J65-9]|uniref:hypothetical protein n=1 Tax=Caulobacter sp. 17J65-9 TaxID=2709382 RepID=UPI0013CC61D1|nr:hypothetical protein [Caulobacter sp. 17J65-9]NEX91937.1 hypothetical protein [Caulobacter sp. 17J65-9]